VLLFLNDDTLVEQPDWLRIMVGFLAESDVGVVGARLLYADGTLQHGGLLLNEQPLHIFHGFAGDDPGPFGLLEIDREVSAVTAAVMLTPRSVFDEVGGFPEEFRIAFNDLDYCLRVRATGRRIVWSAHSTLSHFESQTRRPDADQHEIDLLYRRWGDELRSDPYGNPAFAPKQAVWLPRERATLWAAVRARLAQLRR
jgi:GT2 family glycosyltransferase